MKRQRRFSSENEILTAIDDARELSQHCGIEADKLEKEAIEHARIAEMLDRLDGTQLRAMEKIHGNSASQRFDAKRKLDETRKLRKRAANLTETRIPKLGKVLAAFRTEPMEPITGIDHAVVA